MAATNGKDRASAGGTTRRAHRIAFWLRRYAPAELAATLGAVLAAGVAYRFGGAAAAALAGTAGEAVAFYGCLFIRDRRHRTDRSLAGRGRASVDTLHRLVLEFGPAEVLDTCLVRPLAMYLGPLLTGSLTSGTVTGKIAADLVFYSLAIVSYHLLAARNSFSAGGGRPAVHELDASLRPA